MKSRLGILVLIACAACGGDGSLEDARAAFQIVSPRSDGTVNDASPTVRWNILPQAAGYRVIVARDPAGQSIVERSPAVVGSSYTLTAELDDATVYYVTVVADSVFGTPLETVGPVRCRTLLVPDWFPPFRVVANDADARQPGYRLVSLIDRSNPRELSAGALLLFNVEGEIVWWYMHPGGGQLSAQQPTSRGTIFTIQRGVSYEMDWSGNRLWERPGDSVSHHEITTGPDDNYMYMMWVFEDYLGTSFEGDGIELVDPVTNEIIWTWNIFDHFRPEDFLDIPEAGQQGLSRMGVDWSHSNAITWDADRSIIWMSIRHFDRVIGIDYPSGEVVITLGKGGIGGPELMSHQHAVEIQPDGSLMIWNNGNAHNPQVSRVRQFSFDETLGTHEILFDWVDEPPFFDSAVGDANRLPNGNTLVTAGISGRTIELDPNGRIVWEISMGRGIGYWLYRSELVPAAWLPDWIVDPFD